MTHPPERIAYALELRSRGLTATQAARRLGVPRATVRDWYMGRSPRTASGLGSCDRCSGPDHDFDELPSSYAYLLGLYLGDGCLSPHPRGVYKLRVTLDLAYPEIIEGCAQAIRSVLPIGRTAAVARKKGCVEVYAYWKSWPCLFPQHGPGRKHHRPIVLAPWQVAHVDQHPEQMLRGLIHSDGCRFINTGTNWRSARYSFSNRSADIRGIFCDVCARLGVRWTTCPHTVYVSRKADVAVLDGFIGPKA